MNQTRSSQSTSTHYLHSTALIIIDTERFATVLVVGIQDYRHLLANL